jgi:hypothetical protein
MYRLSGYMSLPEHINLQSGKIMSWARSVCSLTGLALAGITCLIVLWNMYDGLITKPAAFRITLPALCMIFALLTSALSIRAGIIGCLFALPLLPTLAWQIQQYFGYGRILTLHNAGLDLIAGLFLGTLVNQLRLKRAWRSSFDLPWQAGLVMLMLTLSAGLAISRNLHQTESVFQLPALIYHLKHLRSIGWHDDYRPLFDWLVYGSAFALMAVMVPALKSMPGRNHVIFIPLIVSLVIAAMVGYRQSTYGMGLSLDQLNFRVGRFGYMALGFQQDIHAFAGQMLIGAIGLFGYLYYLKSKLARMVLVLAVIPLTWVALFLSKSKSSFALAVVCLMMIAAIWCARHARYTGKVLTGLLLCVVLAIVSAVIFKHEWIAGLTLVTHRLGLGDLDALNSRLSYRPEVYLAGLHMFALFPLMGMGLSEFYRQSASYELTHSYFLSIQQNGENAHNYFLQTLVENGLLGALVFAVLLLYPLWRIQNKRVLIPAWIALGAIFVGNVFAHSMLVRENLFIAASLLALTYAWLGAAQQSGAPVGVNTQCQNPVLFASRHPVLSVGLVIGFIIGLGLLCAKEVYQSFARFPFTADTQCFKPRPLDPDGWTSGQYEFAMPSRAQGVVLNLAGTQPDVAQRPLPAILSLVHNERGTLSSTAVSFVTDAPTRIEVRLPEGVTANDDAYRAVLRLQRCFIPKNMGINADDRRLGVRIQSVETP